LHAAAAADDPRGFQAAQAATAAINRQLLRLRPIRDNPLWHGRAAWVNDIFDHESRDDSYWRSMWRAVPEISYKCSHHYVIVVADHDTGRAPPWKRQKGQALQFEHALGLSGGHRGGVDGPENNLP
jgi:hypothetical protein